MLQSLSYEVLKNIAINDATAQNNLEDLKYMFRNEIGSARNMYRINTMADLIDCLERHDALSEFNIEPLREIADEYGGSLAEIITSYHVPNELLTAQPYNEYQEIRLADECASRLFANTGVNGLSSNMNTGRFAAPANNVKPQSVSPQILTKEKRAAIYKLIAGEIGTGWRCFGRELEIRQAAMDDIEIQYRDLNTRVYKLFQAIEEDESINPKDHLVIICRALDECRRKDLRRRIERMMAQ